MADTKKPEEQTDSGEKTERQTPDTLGRQVVGALIGGAVIWVLATVARQFGWQGDNTTRYVLWGAMVGGLIGGSETLIAAGRRLTRRDNAWLNMAVALLGMAVIAGVIYGLAFLGSMLFRQIMGG
jgi:hypothetical protein